MITNPPAIEHPTFRVLGPLSVWDGDGYQPLPASKPVSMLAALLTSPNEVTSNDFLLRAVWGDEADVEAKPALRTCTTRLRKLLVRHNLGEELIETVSGGYRLRADAAGLDLILFRQRVVAATRMQLSGAQVLALRGALDLWQGSVLCNVGSEVLHRGVVPLLEEERLQVLERIVDLLVREGRDQDALSELASLTRSHDGHERFALQLVGVLTRAGRRQDALEECARIKQHLADELGLDPTPELAAAEMAILRGDPAAASSSPTSSMPRLVPVPSDGSPGTSPGTSPEGRTEGTSPDESPDLSLDPTSSTPGGASEIEDPGGRVHYLRPPTSAEPHHRECAPAPAPLLRGSAFVGREDEVLRLLQPILGCGTRSLFLLVGPPGVGKTSLALHAAARATEVGRGSDGGQVLVRMRDGAGRPRALDDLLAELPSGPTARPSSSGVLVLDDAAREHDVAAIADWLPHHSLLVTTGTPMLRLVRTHGALVHRVEELRMGDALTLLAQLLGEAVVAEDMLAAFEIVTQCWRNPLALRVLAARLQTRPGWSLSTAASWLGEDPVGRLSCGAGDLSLSAHFASALERMDPPLPEAVTSLATLEDEFSLRASCELLPEDRFAPVHVHLHDLVDRGWFEEVAPGRFRVDPFVQACARRLVTPARDPSEGPPDLVPPDLVPPDPVAATTVVGAAVPTPVQLPQEGVR